MGLIDTVPSEVNQLSPQEAYRRGISLYSKKTSAGIDPPALARNVNHNLSPE